MKKNVYIKQPYRYKKPEEVIPLQNIEVCEQGEIIVMAVKGKNIIDAGMECIRLANYLKLAVKLHFNASVIRIFRNTEIKEIVQSHLEQTRINT